MLAQYSCCYQNVHQIAERSDECKDIHETEAEMQREERSAEENNQLLMDKYEKLSLSIQEKIDNFNKSLKSLSTERMSVNEKLRIIELYRTLLAKSVFQSEIDSRSHQKLQKELIRLKDEHEKSKLRLEKAMTAYEEMKTAVKEKANKDRTMNKRFRGRIQNESDHPLDQETLRLLCQLFQRRDITLQSNSDYVDDEYFISVRDPFYTDRKNKDNPFTSEQDTSSMVPKVVDIPEGFSIDDKMWEALKTLREEKIQIEIELAQVKNKAEEAKEYVDTESSEEQNLSNNIARVSDELKVLHQKMEERAKCPEFLISIKQGQDEVKNKNDDKIIADYSDAIFIPSTTMNDANDMVSKLVEERLGILEKIEKVENAICQLKWENEVLELRHQDAKELLKDYRLLKLTPQLRKMLNGETYDPADEEKKFKDQHSQRKLVHDKNMKMLKREKSVLHRAIVKREEDNIRLREQMKSFRETLKSKEKEFQSNKMSEGKADQKMKSIMLRSKCVDKIRIQAEEIKQLRSELDRLRQKTFPSFSPTVSRKLI